MRIYAYVLLVAVAALHAHAATIPVSETEKKLIDIVPEDLDNVDLSSEQDLLDQANTIKDVDNKLRVKPEVIPVEVIVEDAQPDLKTNGENDETEEINRPVPDLRNPGPPQRQEHETQNPEHYASEQQQIVLTFKQSINDAQKVLKQGFQGITDNIQTTLESNVQIKAIQHSIQSLREGFTDQINKLNGTVQNYLYGESSTINKPAVEQTKLSFHQIEKGLNVLRNDFNRGVNFLSDGVDVVALLKAGNEDPIEDSPSSTAAPASPSPSQPQVNPLNQIIEGMRESFSNTLQTLQQYASQFNPFSQGSSTTAVPAGVQADPQVPSATPAASSTTNIIENWQQQFAGLFTGQSQNQSQPTGIQALFPRPGQLLSGSGPFNQFINNVAGAFQPNRPAAQPPQGAQPAPSEQPAAAEQAQPAKPAVTAQAAPVTPAGPIRQILQNNPVSQGIAGAVQRLQNINNPEKPREVEELNTGEEIVKNDEEKIDNDLKKKGHYYGGGQNNSGDNNDSDSSRVEEKETIKEETEKLPEVQKPKEDEVKEHKTEEVVDKTE